MLVAKIAGVLVGVYLTVGFWYLAYHAVFGF